ncbi:preprotein translocase subunit YajC [Wolbachia endosymbiont of Folsomia candida]|uniref:preprotein translocase subunit YajC n=1 Tax=Wolbachia endosymbiont of Folsomia candida TaxID=169402 RepID=UPI000A504727|nr:preprotein translocase subunit YajC [Wolbachia endosymbiont of Folsomia candida]APR98131.1 preprotein translocase subunit YajC [Wolbachia endosymbiont of Folsomia candida]
MFISEVFAADAASNASSVGASFASFIPLVLIFAVFYFLIIRPQHKKLKEHKKIIDQIKRGDMVITSGGIVGEVIKVDEINAQFVIEISPKVEIKVLKSAISEVLNKNANQSQKPTSTPVEKDKTEKDNKKNKGKQVGGAKEKDNKGKKAS